MVVIDQPPAHPTLYSSRSEANVLREQQLQNRRALSLNLCSDAGLTPKVRMKKRPVTQGVPVRGDRRSYLSMSKLSELSQSARLVNQARPKSSLGSLNWLK
jgi:hypothetical protein